MEVIVDNAGVDVQQLVQGGIQDVDSNVNFLKVPLPCAIVFCVVIQSINQYFKLHLCG